MHTEICLLPGTGVVSPSPACYGKTQRTRRAGASLGLEKTSKPTKSTRHPLPTASTEPRPSVPHRHVEHLHGQKPHQWGTCVSATDGVSRALPRGVLHGPCTWWLCPQTPYPCPVSLLPWLCWQLPERGKPPALGTFYHAVHGGGGRAGGAVTIRMTHCVRFGEERLSKYLEPELN